MSVTIQQQPTTPGIVNSDLLFVLTSDKTSEAQMQYVCDIKDNSGTLIQRIKQQPNPSAKAVFNTGQIMTSYFNNTDQIFTTDVVAPNTGSGLNFQVAFGEEYGSSPSSSVVLYNGISATPGVPAKTGSTDYFNLYGTLNQLEMTNWNWNSSSKYNEEDASDDVTFTYQNGLTIYDVNSVYSNDYHTISFLNGNVSDAPSSTLAQNVFAVTCKQYDSTGSLISSSVIYNESIYNDASTELWIDVYTSQSQDTRLVHFPAGPQNWSDAGLPISSSCDYYTLTFNQQATNGSVLSTGIWGEYTFNIGDCTGFTPQRFAWKNTYGVWDYFNFTKANNRVSNIDRKEYTQTFVDYSTTTNSVSYDQQRRGRVNHYNDVTKIRVANTDWLNQTEADNLREMFFSADVFIQDETNTFIPVVITTANITERTNDLAQKMFQYQVTYEHAVGQYSRQ